VSSEVRLRTFRDSRTRRFSGGDRNGFQFSCTATVFAVILVHVLTVMRKKKNQIPVDPSALPQAASEGRALISHRRWGKGEENPEKLLSRKT